MSKNQYTIQHLGKGYMHYIALNEKDVQRFIGKTKRLKCVISNTTLHCALMRSNAIGYYIMLSKAVLKQFSLKLGDTIKAQFSIDDTEIQFKENEALNEVLSTDESAATIWATLTPGNKRSIIYWVSSIKSEERQIQRALEVAKKIKQGITSIKAIMARE